MDLSVIMFLITQHQVLQLLDTFNTVSADEFVGESLSIPKGATVDIPFMCKVPSHLEEYDTSYSYNLMIEGQRRPFVFDDTILLDGFHDASQQNRFSIVCVRVENNFFVNLLIRNVALTDSGTYVLTIVLYLPGDQGTHALKDRKKVSVTLPPNKAQCVIALSQDEVSLYEIRCTAVPQNITNSNLTRISCFQGGVQIISRYVERNRDHVLVIFGIQSHLPVACCSHEIYADLTIQSCQDFVWPYTCSKHISWNFVGTTISPATADSCPATTISSDATGMSASYTFAIVHSFSSALVVFNICPIMTGPWERFLIGAADYFFHDYFFS